MFRSQPCVATLLKHEHTTRRVSAVDISVSFRYFVFCIHLKIKHLLLILEEVTAAVYFIV